MEKICKTTPFLFEDYLILSLSKDWLKVFGEIPTFEATLDDKGKLHLTSTKSILKKDKKVN